MSEQKTAGRGGDRGGRRPKTGTPRTIKLHDELWQFCLSQPGGASEFLRRLIEQAMAGGRHEQAGTTAS